MAAAIKSVNLLKCPHFTGLKTLNSSPHSITVDRIWWSFHPEVKGTKISAVGNSVGHSVDGKVSDWFRF